MSILELSLNAKDIGKFEFLERDLDCFLNNIAFGRIRSMRYINNSIKNIIGKYEEFVDGFRDVQMDQGVFSLAISCLQSAYIDTVFGSEEVYL